MQVHADFVTDLEAAVWLLGWHGVIVRERCRCQCPIAIVGMHYPVSIYSSLAACCHVCSVPRRMYPERELSRALKPDTMCPGSSRSFGSEVRSGSPATPLLLSKTATVGSGSTTMIL